jgi:hypothetical protein
MKGRIWFWKHPAPAAPPASPPDPPAPPMRVELRPHTDMREFWRWCRTASTLNADRMTRAELEGAYRIYCARRNLEPLPSWHFSRSLRSAGFERYRQGGSGFRPWLYRAAPVRPDTNAQVEAEPQPCRERAAA